MAKKREDLYDLYCGECLKPATWIRRTQFSGDHPFCLEHAQKEKDFREEGASYFFWRELSPEEVASKHPLYIKKWNIREPEFPELAMDICNMKYEQIVMLFVCLAEAFYAHSREASNEGRTDLAQLFVQAVNSTASCANDLKRIFAECERKKLG